MESAARDRSDVILAMQEPYMQEIIDGTKTYEFRKYRLADVERIWFYLTAPRSAITHVCEVGPARTRDGSDAPLPENGRGNAEFNARDPSWEGYDYAYEVVSVYALREPITLEDLKAKHGVMTAPSGRVYLPESIREACAWSQQNKLR